MLKKLCLGCVLLLYATAPRLSAQLPKASEYFPLEVGNVWEYDASQGFPRHRFEVVNDTLIGDTTHVYAVLGQTVQPNPDSLWKDGGYLYYWYSPDSSAIYETNYFPNFGEVDYERYKILDTSHGLNWLWIHSEADYSEAMAITDTGTISFLGEEGQFIQVYSGDLRADTLLIRYCDNYTIYVHGIGPIAFGELELLLYAKVGDVEYGTPIITDVNEINTNQKLLDQKILCYPNPAQDTVIIFFPFINPTIIDTRIFNSLGQTVRTFSEIRQNQLIWNCRDDAGKPVPNGVYFISATEEERSLAGKILILR